MKKGAIFDMDGLLLDTERLYRDGWEEMAKEFGVVHNPEFATAVSGSNGETMVNIVRSYYPEVDAKAFIAGTVAYTVKARETDLKIKPGVREILTYFRQNGVKIAVASSSTIETIRENLTRTGLLEYFDACVSGEWVPSGKPAPDIFLLAAEKIGCRPEDCYVFEDSINGVKAGIAAHCTTIMIPDLVQPDDNLRKACNGVYENLNKAKEALGY